MARGLEFSQVRDVAQRMRTYQYSSVSYALFSESYVLTHNLGTIFRIIAARLVS